MYIYKIDWYISIFKTNWEIDKFEYFETNTNLISFLNTVNLDTTQLQRHRALIV